MDGQVRRGSTWQVYARKPCISGTKDDPWKVESKNVKSWKVRSFQVKEALEALSAEAAKYWLNTVGRQRGESLIKEGNGALGNIWRYIWMARWGQMIEGLEFQQKQFGYSSAGSKGWFLEQEPDMIEVMFEEIYLNRLDWKTRSRERRNYCCNTGVKWWRPGLECWHQKVH